MNDCTVDSLNRDCSTRSKSSLVKPCGISVVVPVFDCNAFLFACLGTIFEQTRPPREVFFVDDSSSDNSLTTLRNLEQKYSETVSVVALPENQGPSHARNRGMERARGEWIAFLDADDLWEPDHLESLLERAAETGASVVYSGLIVRDAITGRQLGESDLHEHTDIPEALYRTSFIMPSQAMMRRSLLERGARFDERIRHGEDADFWIQLAEAGAEFSCTHRKTCIYQKRGKTPSQDSEKIATAAAYRYAKYRKYDRLSSRELMRQAARQRWIAARLSWRRDPLRALRHLVCVVTGKHDFL